MVVPAVLETIYGVSASFYVGDATRVSKCNSTNLVKRIEFRPRAQSLRILTEEDLCRCSRINHDYGNVAQLDLIHGSELPRPYTILLRGVRSNLGQIPDQRQACRPLHTLDAGRRANELVEYDIEEGEDEKSGA